MATGLPGTEPPKTNSAPGALVAEEVLFLAWGDGERAVGLRETPDGRYGPQTLCVDEYRRRIHLLDNVNLRILTLGLDGAVLGSLPVPALAEDLGVLPGDRFAVLTPAALTLECVTLTGASCGRTRLPAAPAARGLRRLAGDVPLLWRPDNTVMPLSFDEPDSGERADLVASGRPGVTLPEVSPIVLRRAPDGTAVLESAPPAGGPLTRTRVRRRCGPVESLTPVGRDDAGRLYLAVEERCRATIVRFLEVFSLDGSLVAAAALPSSSYAFVYRDLDLDRGGSVFQLLVRPEGVAVLHWSTPDAPPRASGQRFPAPPPPNPRPPTSPADQEGAARRPITSSDGVELDGAAAANVSRQEIIARAWEYANHAYTLTPGNLTPPGGEHCGGKLVKTPEWLTVGETLIGVPYKWGGLTAVAEWSQNPDDPDCAGTNRNRFDAGLAAGQYAGDTCASSCSGMDCGSHCALGVDCSGFVSRVWGLPSHVTTSALPSSPYTCPSALRSIDDLLAGDVLNRAGSHVRLFVARSPSGSVEVLEASGRDWKVAPHSYLVGELAAYSPYRKRAIGGMFAVAERVLANGAGIDVRPCTDLGSASCEPLGQLNPGQAGTITAGPDERSGYLWWSIAWDGGPSGWTAQCSLSRAAADESTEVVLSAEPVAGDAPFAARLTATVAGTSTGAIDYTVWWDCPHSTDSVAEAAVQCGSVPAASPGTCSAPSQVGWRCTGVWENPASVTHVYGAAGAFTPKVIAERGGRAGESRASVSVREPCASALAPPGAAFVWSATSGSFAVAAQAWCTWTATTESTWIHITAGSGTGDGVVRFTLDANTSPGRRTGTISVAGQSYAVTQAAIRPPRTRLQS